MDCRWQTSRNAIKLKGINPLLNAEVLQVLRAMGHDDDLCIADTNFPAELVARLTGHGRLLRIDRTAAEVVEAVLSVYPLDWKPASWPTFQQSDQPRDQGRSLGFDPSALC